MNKLFLEVPFKRTLKLPFFFNRNVEGFQLVCFVYIDDDDLAWYPRQKVQSARKKLEGFNPAYVMRFVQAMAIMAFALA